MRNYKAVVPKITGTAKITDFINFLVDERDEIPEGFLFE
ncbi:proline racemase family protein [Lentibacillus halodurans]|nr:proline racemase family protein [Lentibacillus halodurans]